MYFVLAISLETEQEQKFVKDHEDDAQIILSEPHEHHTNIKMDQHEIVELTSYTTNLYLTDPWKQTYLQFLAIISRLYDSWIVWSYILATSLRLPACSSPANC